MFQKWALGRPPRVVHRDCTEDAQVSLERQSRGRGPALTPGNPILQRQVMADSPDGLLSAAVLCEGRRRPLR